MDVLTQQFEKQVKLPTIKKKEKTPFHMPNDAELILIKKAEQEKATPSGSPRKVYEKGTKSRRNYLKDLDLEEEDTSGKQSKQEERNDTTEFALLQPTIDISTGGENLQDFVARKKEMFLVQYTLGIKKDEISKLEVAAMMEEQKLLEDEKALEEDAAKFDAFLKENDKNSVEAIKRAEQETKAKLEKMQEIKKLNMQILQIRSEMSKNEDQLQDFKRYREFLTMLTPASWLEQHRKIDVDATVTDGLNDIEMYFKHPQQLLDIFTELESNNLSLITTSQETEEFLEDLKQKLVQTNEKLESETQTLRQQVDILNVAIAKEEAKASALEDRAKRFRTESTNTKGHEDLLVQLNKKVEEVYKKCIGENDSNLDVLQMLTSLENRLNGLFERIELLPPDKVELAEKAKEKERRQRLREEKLDLQKKQQEERVQRAIERAKAPVIKKVGKPVTFRSELPQMKKKKAEVKENDVEDLRYYFE